MLYYYGPKELIEQRRPPPSQGYRPGLVQLSLDWAVSSAEGMANYFAADGVPSLYEQMLPKYLQDAERWIKSLQGES